MSIKPDKARNPSHRDWLTGGGEMGKLIREMDWSKTPLGPIESWPQSLRTTVSLCLASNFPISIAWGPQRTQIYNDGYWPICGAKHPHSMGQDFRECWYSAWPVIGEAFDRASAGESSFLVNQRMFIDRNGYLEETFFTFSFSPINDETGKVGGLFHPVTEMTDQTLAERRLKALRDLADRTADAKTVEEACTLIAKALEGHELDLPFALLYLIDADGKRASLAASVGIQPGTAFSANVVDLCGEAMAPWPLANVARVRRPEEVHDLEMRIGTFACGPYSESPKTALALPIILPGLEQTFGVLVAGVSRRRAVDNAYRTFYRMLGEGVVNAIANARAYEEERKRAEALAEIDRAKIDFFSNVSHEFRTPLTLMLGPIEDSLAEDKLPPQTRERLEVAYRNSLRLLKLVNNLLDFSRIEAGRVQAVYEPTNLASFTAELTSSFRSAIERAGLKLVVDCPSLNQPVYVDREMWEKIVLNLISNAFKFTLEGEIVVKLRIADCGLRIDKQGECGEIARQGTGKSAILTVRDTGEGIPAEETPHIFERFHRVKSAKGRSYEGSGIGLALVQELVKLHGGTIRVESELGRGSAFTISIPLGSAHLPAERVKSDKEEARAMTATATGATAFVEEALMWLPEMGRGESGAWNDKHPNRRASAEDIAQAAPLSGSYIPHPRVLLADDNADMREYIQRLLAAHYDVEAVADGEAALEAALRHPPDLVLTDVMMPKLDGFGLLKALRANEQLKAIPIILLSARAGEESRVEGLRAGADDYLVKPFTARELLARVEGRLQLQRARREAQMALRESEEKFSAAFEQSPLALTITSLEEGRLVEVNESFVRLSGYTREEAVGRTVGELKLWVEPELRVEWLGRHMEGEQVSGVEIRFRKKGGEEMIGAVSSSLIEVNSRPHILSSIADITQRKRREANLAFLAEVQDDFARLSSAHEIMQTAGAKIGSYLNISCSFFVDIDEARDEARINYLWKSDDAPRLPDVLRTSDFVTDEFFSAARAGETIVVRDTETDPRTGAESYVALKIRSYVAAPFHKNGEWKFLLVICDSRPRDWREDEIELFRDLANRIFPRLERARAEEALRESRVELERQSRIFNATLSTITDFTYLFDREGRFVFANQPLLDLWGLKLEEVVGKNFYDLGYPDELAAKLLRQIEQVFDTAETLKDETQYTRPTGVSGYYEYIFTPLLGVDGAAQAVVGSTRDITERKRAEEKIARLLADEQAAREVAEHATRAKDEFLGVVSHELRSPLNAILGWNRLLRSKHGDDPMIVKVIETIERSGKAQLQLIEDLLDTTRIIAGKMKLETAPVELADVISSALDTVRPAAHNKSIVITMNFDSEAGQITGDPNRLLQVVWNLLSNAIKFTPMGGQVWVELRRAGPDVQIVVRDTGQGISPDLLPYVFDRFKQGDSSASRRFGGLGLGLALVKHLVELHGGGVAVESPGEGQGTTFTVNLPVRAVRGDSGTEKPREGKSGNDQFAPRRPQPITLEGVRALVVDDEDEARELLTIALERHGASVRGVDSAAAAIAALESQLRAGPASAPFDVLISDIGMPGADGYELIRRVRAHPDERVRGIRAVALTAYARSEDRQRALQAGFYMHVPKPVDEEELTIVIAALMGGISGKT